MFRYTDAQLEPADSTLHGNQSERHPSTRVVQVFAGYEHSLLMMADGSIWCCGRNDAGQCGVSLPGSVEGDLHDVTFPLRLPVAPGLYALPTTETGCLASASFLLRKATHVSTVRTCANPQLHRTRSVTVRLHTPPLPRAIAYEDPAVILAQTSQAIAQTEAEPIIETRILQPAELQSLTQQKTPWVDDDFPPVPRSLAHDWERFQAGDERELSRGLLWTEIEWKRPSEIKLCRPLLGALVNILYCQYVPAVHSLLVRVFNLADIRNGKATLRCAARTHIPGWLDVAVLIRVCAYGRFMLMGWMQAIFNKAILAIVIFCLVYPYLPIILV